MNTEAKPKGYGEGIIAYMNLTDQERETLDSYYTEERKNNPVFQKLETTMKQVEEEGKRASEHFDKHIFPQMSESEVHELIGLEMCGLHQLEPDDSLTVLMSKEAFERVDKYRKSMIEKYGSRANSDEVNPQNQGA